MRIGSLCSGAGGLDMAVEKVFGATTAWHCEINDAASKVLEYRYPGVPNHRDIIGTDWSTVEPVEIMAFGWPCQPFSLAGKQKGAEDERAIWPHIAGAIRTLRPSICVMENVSAVVGSGELARVAGDLSSLGYDLRWVCLRAGDIGAPHRRERVFIVAHAQGIRWGVLHTANIGPANREVNALADNRDAATDTTRNGRDERWPESTRVVGGSDASLRSDADVDLLPTPRSSRGASSTETMYLLGGVRSDDDRTQGEVLLPTPKASDAQRGDSPSERRRNDPSLVSIDYYLPTPQASDGCGGSHLSSKGHQSTLPGEAREIATQWGKYAAAIHRWGRVVGPAPAPTEPNRNGKPRLNPAFSEWLMGWPAGWVTDVPGISRNDQLRIIGNGVVPQCAEAALRWLLNVRVAA